MDQIFPSLPAPASVAVIGAGRLGGVLARALRAAGLDVHGPLRRGDGIPEVGIALLCVPDAAIADAALVAKPRARFVGHVSGATPLNGIDFSIHPLQTFTGEETPNVFHGIGCAIDARSHEALTIATSLAELLGARVFRVDDAHRAEYHAAASFASNFVLTVLDAAEQLAASAGIDGDDARDLLAPLVRRTVDNWQRNGSTASLTGPIARGDEATVARQRGAVDDTDPELTPLFDKLALATRSIARQKATA